MYGLKQDWSLEPSPRHFVLEDYESLAPRWCPGCGDLAVLTAIQRLCRDEQLPPEQTVFVSGIGCSSRFPHYMKTYGFHGLHGRAMPVAEGVRMRRPDLHVFAITGDGDGFAIGTSHSIHSIRYNMNMSMLLLDNNIYGLTKMQSSPTTEKGHFSNTHPRGAILSPLNPLTMVLGMVNASFVAQTVDWNPMHLYATLRAAHQHQGLSFVRILQRCPHYMDSCWTPLQEDPSQMLLLEHEDGIVTGDALKRVLKNSATHDPNDLNGAFAMAGRKDIVPLGLIYRNPDAERYDQASTEGMEMTPEERLEALNAEMDSYQV